MIMETEVLVARTGGERTQRWLQSDREEVHRYVGVGIDS